jgi:imidazole glycerol-phosphate synthase subunit HisH
MIAVVDFGAGNLRSMRRALEIMGAETRITNDPNDVRAAEAVVLPGDGHAGYSMDRLVELGLTAAIFDVVADGKPFLGVCVGMQLLFEHQEEGDLQGLGLLPGRVRGLRGNVKLPHIGWSQSRTIRSGPLGIEGDLAYYYFLHSYIAEPDNHDDIAAVVTYGETYPSVVVRDNIWGTQFHPEKSGTDGLALVSAFVKQVAPVAAT